MGSETIEVPQAHKSPRKSPTFEELLKCSPVCESLLLQIPSDSILALYHTCSSLRQFLRDYPTSWKYLSYRLYQPALVTASQQQNNNIRQSGNYAIDQLLIYVVNPFSTCLTSLELDNTQVSGLVLYQTVLALRRATLEHLSIRGCKNVSLKYHINPWLNMFAIVGDLDGGAHAPAEYRGLALKSLYTYRCRHHRRRPYLPASLQRKDSDSEPTHELVNLCHKLGIWTDTAWCTTPGGRCFRRRGYSTMRGPQDHREVWVVFDRLWRSRNWLGPTDQTTSTTKSVSRKRKRDCRSWEFEEAARGEALGVGPAGKGVPAHLRDTHREFVDDIKCDNCSATILERCEQCSVIMHCTGCRKTLCSSCAFDRPYLRNANATLEEANKFWWAPGCAISPCSMQDQDLPPVAPGGNANPANNTALPNLKFKWCCAEPVFSGGGGITFSPAPHPTDAIRAAPVARHKGWEDTEFTSDKADCVESASGPGGRWKSLDAFFRRDDLNSEDHSNWSVPRNLCDDCYSTEQWKLHCKACQTAICLKHDLRDRLRARLCGYKDLAMEKSEFRVRQRVQQKAAKVEAKYDAVMHAKKDKIARATNATTTSQAHSSNPLPTNTEITVTTSDMPVPTTPVLTPLRQIRWLNTDPGSSSSLATPALTQSGPRSAASDEDVQGRPMSPDSNSTSTPSRGSSPSPSVSSNPESLANRNAVDSSHTLRDQPPGWRGCQSFFCSLTRAPGDHRRRCTSVVRQCTDCKVNTCGDCITAMEPNCLCRGCREPCESDDSIHRSQGLPRFYCPNCRWQRRQTGSCKRRVAANRDTKKPNKFRKPLRDRLSAANGNGGSNPVAYEDSAAEMLGEFFENLAVEDGQDQRERNHNDNDNDDVISVDETAEDCQELEDMSVVARDLLARIQNLRAQMRPAAGANLIFPAALPHIRVEAGEDEAAGVHVEDMD